jgi:predicted DNA-binding transcriptional regulator AlpA
MKLLIDIREVAAALGVSKRTVYALRARPDFPSAITLASRCVRYRASDVAEFVERLAADTAHAPEPETLRAGRAQRRGAKGGPAGGIATPAPADRPLARGTADGLSVEPSESMLRVAE